MNSEKKNIVKAAVIGGGFQFAFVMCEYAAWKAGLFGTGVTVYIVDSAFRIAFGVIELIVLMRMRGRLKDLFTNPIPKSVWLLLIPVYVYFLSYLLGFGMVERASMKNALPFLAVILQQVTTGLYEETACRGIVMAPFEERTDERKARVTAVVISGVIFGMSHCLNFLFGGTFDLGSTAWTVFCTGMWGMFVAAVYMVSHNLLFVMCLHAVWDIWIRIPNSFFALSDEPTALASAGEVLRDVLDPFVMGILAIIIAISCDKLKKKDK